MPPYDEMRRFTLVDAVQRYWFGLLLGALSLIVMAFLTTWVTRLNKRLTRAKARLEQRQELLLNSVAEGIYGVDLDGKTTFVNKPMERITGWQADELIGENQHELLHHTYPDGNPHPADECPVYATFRDNRPRFIDDDVFWRKDGSSFPVEYSSTPIRDEEGETLGSVVVFRDVTERKLAAEKIRNHQLELAHVARLSTMGEMASGIAHELNQPLTAITTNARACVRILEAGRTTLEQCSDVMEKIANQAERAGQVIRHIRHFVRKEEPDLRPARLSAMLDTALGLLRPDAPALRRHPGSRSGSYGGLGAGPGNTNRTGHPEPRPQRHRGHGRHGAGTAAAHPEHSPRQRRSRGSSSGGHGPGSQPQGYG